MTKLEIPIKSKVQILKLLIFEFDIHLAFEF
jgi:hypothetical protein